MEYTTEELNSHRGQHYARRDKVPHYVTETASTGYKLGSVIAVAISWSLNESILWAIVHGVLGWFYVGYYLLFIR